MCKYSKLIIKKVKQLQTIQTDIRSSIEKINTLIIFISKINKEQRKINQREESFLEEMVLLLMQELNGVIKKEESDLLIECLSLINSKKKIDQIDIDNECRAFNLDFEEDDKEGKEEENKLADKSIDPLLLENLKANLKTRIYSQDEAIEKVVNKIKISIAGLGDDNKPIGSFLFTGSTGVGKTELAKELAKQLNIDFIRFDMSEYNNSEFGIAKLIGSAPGYHGYKDGGLLTNAVKEKPFSVLLLDEIEKADYELMSIFLQMMDNAEITDGQGSKVSFKNIIIIMTSNLGVKTEPVAGFTKAQINATDEAIKSFFSPEFINRLDSIVNFNPLHPDVSLNIVDKFLMDTAVTLDKKNIKINVSNEAKTQLSILGYNREMGARAMSRVISSNIKMPISEEILYGKLKNGGDVDIDYINQEFCFCYSK